MIEDSSSLEGLSFFEEFLFYLPLFVGRKAGKITSLSKYISICPYLSFIFLMGGGVPYEKVYDGSCVYGGLGS